MENEKYFKSLLKKFDAEIKKMKAATTPNEVSYHERQALPLLTEMQLALPRLGNDLQAESRHRRSELLGNK